MQKVVFITGISSGFGKCTAEYMAQKGHVIYGTSRKEIEFEGKINVLKADVTDIDSVKAAVETILLKEGRIDVLINNAGMGISGSVEFAKAEDIKLQMDTNFMGIVNVIQSVLPAMREQQKGTIINISSIGGLMGLPFQGFYSASKFAVEGLSDALRMELKPFNIKVIVIRPGDFITSFTSNRKIDGNINGNNPYDTQFRKSMSIIETDERGGMKPDFLARKLTSIIDKKSPRSAYIISTAEQKLAVVLKRLLPESFFSGILGSHYGIK
ncbi:MAG TPA: SDR family oxidoreductase [Prolixibacteraceae bacterium]|jgi:NADP-dependent 3-hydroxy acid dehydrogenase YdfG